VPWSKPGHSRHCIASGPVLAEVGNLVRPMGAGRTELPWAVSADARAAGTQ